MPSVTQITCKGGSRISWAQCVVSIISTTGARALITRRIGSLTHVLEPSSMSTRIGGSLDRRKKICVSPGAAKKKTSEEPLTGCKEFCAARARAAAVTSLQPMDPLLSKKTMRSGRSSRHSEATIISQVCRASCATASASVSSSSSAADRAWGSALKTGSPPVISLAAAGRKQRRNSRAVRRDAVASLRSCSSSTTCFWSSATALDTDFNLASKVHMSQGHFVKWLLSCFRPS
mmetsp:Transcript_70483/g.150983  ORF Transcript_70483/g.150983 Transcript_70483/m.150983 type:complete len:233 (-) Transcript_70483:609-1307(-)